MLHDRLGASAAASLQEQVTTQKRLDAAELGLEVATQERDSLAVQLDSASRDSRGVGQERDALREQVSVAAERCASLQREGGALTNARDKYQARAGALFVGWTEL